MYKKIINILRENKDPKTRRSNIEALFTSTIKKREEYVDGTVTITLREASIVRKKYNASNSFIEELVHMDIYADHIFYAESWSNDNYKCIFVPMEEEIKNQKRLIELLIVIMNIWGETVPVNYTINTMANNNYRDCETIKNMIDKKCPEYSEKIKEKSKKENGNKYAFIILDDGIDRCTNETYSKDNLSSGHTDPYFLDVIAMPI